MLGGKYSAVPVLWNGGIRFGGVIAFIFADLIILPILNIYRKYYGLKMAGFLLDAFYAAMAGAALIVELIIGGAGVLRPKLVPIFDPHFRMLPILHYNHQASHHRSIVPNTRSQSFVVTP
jgi:hypothetical protein